MHDPTGRQSRHAVTERGFLDRFSFIRPTQFPRIGHVQIAGVPERHEPGRGEVSHAALLERLDELGYRSWVGCEYRPAAETTDGLAWVGDYGIKASLVNGA